MFHRQCVARLNRLVMAAALSVLLVGDAYGQPARNRMRTALRRLPRIEQVEDGAQFLQSNRVATTPAVTDSLDVPYVDQEAPHVQLMPPDYQPWWQPHVIGPLRPESQVEHVDITQLVLEALVYSEHIKALHEQPAIRELAILEAESEFDATTFMESKFIKTSEPVGDQLTTGGPPPFRESDWTYAAGVRRKTAIGGRLEASQRIGYLDSNSTFLSPTQQGNARMTLSFEQPLLRGAGNFYNTSLIVLAQLDTNVAHNQTTRKLQNYLLDVHRAYWELYLQRAVLLQMRRSLERAHGILTSLEERRNFDSLQSQIIIARAAVATRRSGLVRAAAAVRNAQARIAATVNSPLFLDRGDLELLPAATPKTDYVPVSLDDALVTALSHRPEVEEALSLLEAARVRLQVSKNELLPALSLVLETYVSGLQGNSNIGRAVGNQFQVGEPSYSAGLLFEMPFRNRGAEARRQRRHRELNQLTHRFNALVANLRAEVEVAVREVNTTYSEVQRKYSAMSAASVEVEFMTQRFELLPGDDRAASFLLEDLLTAQDRLSGEEFGFCQRADLLRDSVGRPEAGYRCPATVRNDVVVAASRRPLCGRRAATTTRT
jgi:outer membrane protein